MVPACSSGRCVVVVVVVVVAINRRNSCQHHLLFFPQVCSAHGVVYTRFPPSAIYPSPPPQGRLLSRNPALAPFNRQIIEFAPSSAPPILYITTRNDLLKQDKSWIQIQTHMRQPPRYPWIPLNSPKHHRQSNHNNPTSSLRPHPPMPNLLKSQTVLHNYHAHSSSMKAPILYRRRRSTCPLLLSFAPRRPSP